MQENSFEKGVRQKMDELSFEPSAPVWQKVEIEIRQERRRRRLLLLLLLPLVLAGGAGTWYFATNAVHKEATGVAQVNKAEHLNEPVVSPAEPNNTVGTNKAITESKEVVARTTQKEKETFLVQKEKGLQPKQKANQTFANEIPGRPKKRAIEKEAGDDLFENDLHALVLQNEIDKKEGRVSENENVLNPFQPKKEREWKKLAELAKINSETIVSNPAADSVQNTETAVKMAAADSVTFPVTPVTKGKKDVWQWGLNARVGVSGLRSDVAYVFSAERSADFAAAPSTGGNNQQPAPRIAGEIKNNVAFTIGGSIRRKTFGVAAFSLGLQYSYYSTKSTVGTKVAADTMLAYNGRFASLSNYFTSTGEANTYIARYHYVEVPLAIAYTPFKKLPLQLEHGLSMGYLLASNALVQNAASGIYFRSDDWLRKTGFNFFTSLDYRLLNRPSFSLLAGPQLQWSLTPVHTKDAPKKQHLFFAGLHTQWHF